MNPYTLNISRETIEARIKSLLSLDEKARECLYDGIAHELIGGLTHAIMPLARILEKEAKKPSLTIFQQAYLQNIVSTSDVAMHRLTKLLGFLTHPPQRPEFLTNEAYQTARAMHTLTPYLPMRARMQEIGTVTPAQTAIIEQSDISFLSVAYTFNLEFSPQPPAGPYWLNKDLQSFCHQLHAQRGIDGWFFLDLPQVPDIETGEDYFRQAVLPILTNVAHHAWDPANDMLGRLNPDESSGGKKFYTYCGIGHTVDEEHKEVTIFIRDNGFGIPDHIFARLFEKGTTSSQGRPPDEGGDAGEQPHGRGLYLVKEFIERNHGRIWAETKKGEGATFFFTIPYTTKTGHFYLQQKQ